MEHVSSVRPTGKFPEKVENLKRWARFPGWNFWTECRVPFTFLVVCTSSRSTVGHRATYRGLRPNGTTFYQSEIPLLLPPKFPGFFRKWKAPILSIKVSTLWRIQIFTEVRRPFIQSKIGECLASQIICLSPANFGLRLNYGPGSPRAPPIVLPLLRYSDSFKRKYEAKQN